MSVSKGKKRKQKGRGESRYTEFIRFRACSAAIFVPPFGLRLVNTLAEKNTV